MNELKVLTVNTFDTFGGAAVAAYRIHQGVRLIGINSIFLVKHKLSDDKTVISIDEFDNSSKLTSLLRWIYNKINNKLYQLKWSKYPNKKITDFSDLRSVPLHDALKKIEFDILHLHWINGRFFDLKELKSVKKPIVWTLHDNWPFTGICHYFYDCIKFKTGCGTCPLLNSSQENDLSHIIWKEKNEIYSSLNMHIVAPSNWMAESSKESKLFSNFPVTVIPNPSDSRFFSTDNNENAFKKFNLDRQKNYILFASLKVFSDKRKGFTELLKILDYLSNIYECKSMELIVIGAVEQTTDFATSIPIRYLGIVSSEEAMLMAYKIAEVTVVPSFCENLSNTIMESLACSTPVVAFNIGGNGDMIDHKKNGYLAEPYSTEDFANGIIWCLEHNSKGEIGKNARRKVTENFSIDIISGMYKKLYESLQ